MRDPNNPCLFCSTKKDDIIEENQFAYATFDSYPVSSHHSLIIPKRHVKEYFELSNEEVIGCDQLIKKVKIKTPTNKINEFKIYSIKNVFLIISK